MIFGVTMIEAILKGRKTVTRRVQANGPKHGEARWHPGSVIAVQPGRGKHAVAQVLVKSVRDEQLDAMTDDDARAEGFEDLSGFVGYWIALHGAWTPAVRVWVIEFELIHREENTTSV